MLHFLITYATSGKYGNTQKRGKPFRTFYCLLFLALTQEIEGQICYHFLFAFVYKLLHMSSTLLSYCLMCFIVILRMRLGEIIIFPCNLQITNCPYSHAGLVILPAGPLQKPRVQTPGKQSGVYSQFGVVFQVFGKTRTFYRPYHSTPICFTILSLSEDRIRGSRVLIGVLHYGNWEHRGNQTHMFVLAY